MRSLNRLSIPFGLTLLIGCSVSLAKSRSEAFFQYPEGRHKAGQLSIVNGLPVLIVAGTPEEIGEQIGILAIRPAPRLLQIPVDLLKRRKVEHLQPILMQIGKAMLPRFPDDYRREMEAMSRWSGADKDLLTVVNTIDDIERIGGCSSITIDAGHSETGGPLMARNFDYRVPDYVPSHSLVTVYRPKGKLSFASVSFPGLLGVMSGINEAGLTLATHEIEQSADGSPSFTPDGTPMTMSFRRVLEECRTVAEAERLMRSVKRTTYLSIAVADSHNAVVLELTPKSVVVRKPEVGTLICTNHFRTPELRVGMDCWRYKNLANDKINEKQTVAQLWQRLDKASWNGTFQSMIFEPATLKLHLAIGDPPATSHAPRVLELVELMKN